MTTTAVKERPKSKKAARPAPANTGFIEIETPALIRVVSALDHIRSRDESRSVLECLHFTVADDGKSAVFHATDSYVAARLTVELIDGTPRLDAMVKLDPAEIRRLKQRYIPPGNALLRVGRTGSFGLSGAGNWTGRGVHIADGDRLAFGEVEGSDVPFPDIDGLLAKYKGTHGQPPAFNPDILIKLSKAANAWRKGVSDHAPLKFVSTQQLDASVLEVSVFGGTLELLAMPVRTGP